EHDGPGRVAPAELRLPGDERRDVVEAHRRGVDEVDRPAARGRRDVDHEIGRAGLGVRVSRLARQFELRAGQLPKLVGEHEEDDELQRHVGHRREDHAEDAAAAQPRKLPPPPPAAPPPPPSAPPAPPAPPTPPAPAASGAGCGARGAAAAWRAWAFVPGCGGRAAGPADSRYAASSSTTPPTSPVR